jgi:hypothetical protein
MPIPVYASLRLPLDLLPWREIALGAVMFAILIR